MGLFTSWKQRFEEIRARQLAKIHSDEIDRQIKEEAKAAPFKQQAIILLMSIPEYEEEASTLIGQMKLVHGDDWRKEPADFRPEIWKILLENARSIVMAVQTRNVWLSGHANIANCEYIIGHRIDVDNPQFAFEPKFAQAVQDLWVEDVISILLDWPPRISTFAID